jgi:hypothetical protein
VKYRDIEYSVSDTGNAKWRWKIHRKLEDGVVQPILFGVGDTQDDAVARAKQSIDQILDA